MNKNKNIFLNGLIDLAQSRLGSKVVYKTDEFFAPAKRIINPWPPIFKEGVFDKHGKWMDGWETRRKRNKGHDYLILKLGRPGRIQSLKKFLDYVLKHDDVWICKRIDIAEHWIKNYQNI